MSVQELMKDGALVVGAAGITMATNKLANMSSEDLKAMGDKISGTVDSLGDKIETAWDSNEFIQNLKEKFSETTYGPTIISYVDNIDIGDRLSEGAGKLWDSVLKAKEASELDGSSFIGNLKENLSDLVSEGADYMEEADVPDVIRDAGVKVLDVAQVTVDQIDDPEESVSDDLSMEM